MTHYEPVAVWHRPLAPIHVALVSFPIACFTLTVFTDLFYIKTSNLLWLHFSEWLLLAGLVFGGLALVLQIVDFLVWRLYRPWLAVVGGLVVLTLATINSFVHTADGWTAVLPWGIALSVVTVIAMLVTAWLAHRRPRHV